MPTYGVKALRKLQFGKEGSSAGTAAAATTIWRGEGALADDRTVVFPAEDIGILGGVDRSYVPMLAASLAVAATPATFEQLPYIGEMGVKTATPSSDGSGSDWIYDYLFATTSQNSIMTYTIEGGDNAQVERMEYCHVPDFKLSGKANEALMMSATIHGRQVSTLSAFTTGLSIPSVEAILFNKGKLYIDAVNGTIGTTQATNTWLEMAMSVTTGFQGIPTGDGNLYFSFVKQVKPVITLDLKFEMDSTLAVAEKAAWRAGTARQLRMQFAGNALTSTGTLFATKILRIDLAGKWSKFTALGEDKGDDVVVGTFMVGYDSTAALYADMKIVNELTALT